MQFTPKFSTGFEFHCWISNRGCLFTEIAYVYPPGTLPHSFCVFQSSCVFIVLSPQSTGKSIFGSFLRSLATMALIPSAVSAGVFSLALFVPIINTAALGLMPSILP